jgi:hypothetical protein
MQIRTNKNYELCRSELVQAVRKYVGAPKDAKLISFSLKEEALADPQAVCYMIIETEWDSVDPVTDL